MNLILTLIVLCNDDEKIDLIYKAAGLLPTEKLFEVIENLEKLKKKIINSN